jgi:hypothetical protein
LTGGDRGRSKIADATQLFGNFLHHCLRQAAKRPKQPPAINRAGLIDHDLAGASVASHPFRQLNTQDVLSGQPGCAGKDPRARMVRLVQEVRLDYDNGPDLSRLATAAGIQVRRPELAPAR